MRGLRNIYNHPYTLSFLVVFLVLNLVRPAFVISVNTLTSSKSLTVSSNRTILSPGHVFELGLFKPASNSSKWYLGMWYHKVPEAYVWVANRDNPLSKSIGILKISGGNIVLLDHSDTLVWSTNLTGNTRSPLVAELLDNGNFVLRESSNKNDPDGLLWQSFDFPTDTLLPQMKLGLDRKTGRNKVLIAWKSLIDPSTGNFSYKLELQGLPEFFLLVEGGKLHRSGPWDGIRFSGLPEKQVDYMVYNYTDNREEIFYTFSMTNQSIHSRLTVGSQGRFDRLTWIPTSLQWYSSWTSPKDECDLYGVCGPYSYCDANTSPICNCIKGFDPKNPQDWELSSSLDGCVRRTQLSCRDDKFLRLKKIKLPDTRDAIVDRRIGLKECEERCLKDCNCTAVANIDIRGSGCLIWIGDIMDIRTYAVDGQDLYVRLAASDIEAERNKSGKIIGLIVGLSIMLLLSFIMFCFWKKMQKQARAIAAPFVHEDKNQGLRINEVVIFSRRQFSRENKTEDPELPLIEFKAVVIATNNFSDSNKLGQGGFGIVYKGKLLDGQEVAVKRLSDMSTQGTSEFKNEVKLIAKLQHINLVRLLGCCIDANETILIYEYLENLSLDLYLFDKTRSSKLNWQMRFDIISGIARGLLYLHQDSRFRIIHRDLKASNILLDKDMIPKISDFGMARIFDRDETEANTKRVVGTYGYMAPEYAMYGIFSMKSDVFSFGVLLLEIISGKRNKGFSYANRDPNLLDFVWSCWEEGNWLGIVDPFIDSSSSTFRPHEILRCIQIGLLCVQQRAENRPMMSSVVLMFGSETTAIPQPQLPGFCVGRTPYETDSSLHDYSLRCSRNEEFMSVNEITRSVIDSI